MDHLINKVFNYPKNSRFPSSFLYDCPKTGVWIIPKDTFVNHTLPKLIGKILKY